MCLIRGRNCLLFGEHLGSHLVFSISKYKINIRENRRGNPETLATMGHKTQDEDKQNTKAQHRKLKRYASSYF
jgi:hypothetical protein